MAKRRQAVRRSPAGSKAATKRRRAPADLDLRKQITTLKRELAEALERQTAASEVLEVISSTPGELEPVFQAMLENATRICGATFGQMNLYQRGSFRPVAHYNVPAAYAASLAHTLFQPHPQSGLGTVARTRRVVHIEDIRTLPPYLEGNPSVVALADLAGARTYFVVPMLKENKLIGAITIYRREVKPFTEKQTELVSNFAKQAVIAIENTRLFNETQEALERQTATAEVLKVISRSAFDLQPVLDTIVQTASRLCDAEFAQIWKVQGDKYDLAATNSTATDFVKYSSDHPLSPGRGSIVGRTVLDRKTVHLPDCLADPEYKALELQKLGQYRSILGVPLLREGVPIGVIALMRAVVLPFTDKQIELVSTFADQAVIAIENVRLFDEVQARTEDLRESLQQQTATTDVLKIISSSPGALEPVFQAMLENATRICEAKFGTLYLNEGDGFRAAAMHNAPPTYKEARALVVHPPPDTTLWRAAKTKQVAQVADVTLERGYIERDPFFVSTVALGGHRSILSVPMLHEDKLIGIINIFRQEVRPFTDKQIELLTNFAAQAVIAIENTRLLNELRESLQQQTATADVLKVISRSTFDLQTVLDTLVESAARLCQAHDSVIFLRKGEGLSVGAHYGPIPMPIAEWPIGRKWVNGRAFVDRTPVHVYDLQASANEFPDGAEMALRDGHRTIMAVPLLREDETIGTLAVRRTEVKPFTEKQIELLTTFADQAVIAIENVRLFDEVQARTGELSQSVDELRALGEVSQAVNSTVDLETVLNTIVAKATQLSSTEAGAIYVFDQTLQEFNLRATYGMDDAIIGEIKDRRIHIGDTMIGEAVQRRLPIQIPDIQDDSNLPVIDVIVRAGFRALLIVPLLGGDRIVGALVVRRKQPSEFPKHTVDLLQTFAAQSVLAIQNARLFESVEARTRELAISLEELRAAQERLVQTEKLASLGQLTAGIAHEIKNPLNFINNFSAVSVELVDELDEALKPAALDNKTRKETDELTHILKGNLEKVVQHGKRADSIVKNMLLHSRQGSGEHRPVDVNALVEESLNLAYHGARAEKPGFNITLKRSFDPNAGEVDVFPQEITRVLLNLISNGFYAATKRKGQVDTDGYEPTLAATTKNLGDSVEITIRDSGTGIPPEVKEKMFNPFFTTKPAGEGTGLGLSLSYDIVVKQHAGSIDVDTQPGEFTEFKVILPRMAARTKAGADK